MRTTDRARQVFEAAAGHYVRAVLNGGQTDLTPTELAELSGFSARALCSMSENNELIGLVWETSRIEVSPNRQYPGFGPDVRRKRKTYIADREALIRHLAEQLSERAEA